MAQAAIDAPDLEPEDKKAPWPLRYTLVSCPKVNLLFFALRARVAFVEALKGFAFLLGAAFRLVLFLFLTATFLPLVLMGRVFHQLAAGHKVITFRGPSTPVGFTHSHYFLRRFFRRIAFCKAMGSFFCFAVSPPFLAFL